MSNLVKHAENELRLAGLFDEDSDYEGMLGKAALDIVKVFADQGHSGYSAAITTSIVAKLMMFEPLTPLTNDPEEWNQVEMGDTPQWQSRRKPNAFSHDGGKTYYVLGSDEKFISKEKTDGSASESE